MIVEPFAHDKLEDNLNPIGRVFYAASTMLCTPASLSQEVGLALGAQAGEGRLARILNAAGFTRVRRAAETPFNIVLEARVQKSICSAPREDFAQDAVGGEVEFRLKFAGGAPGLLHQGWVEQQRGAVNERA